MQTLSDNVKGMFRAKRYMDDILLIMADSPRFDTESFTRDFCKSECYLPPLKLEKGGEDVFLETKFRIEDNKIRYCLKNENVIGEPKKIWRYAHFNSGMAFEQKRSIMMACLNKVATMASDNKLLYHSGLQKLDEFKTLNYPAKMLWTACTTMGVKSRNPTWFEIRQDL